jgi:hypothetical protein
MKNLITDIKILVNRLLGRKVSVVTPYEMNIIECAAYSDHSSDGHGLGGYVDACTKTLDSLQERGIIGWEENPDDFDTSGEVWVYICSEYQKKANTEEGYALTNLIVK